jgi:putative DNA primase/helicase
MLITDNHLAKINTDLGSEIGPFNLDNEFHHFGVNGLVNATKKPLWAIGKTWEYKGNAYFYVQYGDFRGGSKFQLASYDLRDANAAFRKAHNEQIKEIEKKTAEEKAARRAEGIKKWKPRFFECNPDKGVHEYLAKKSIDKNYRARVSYNNSLLVPLESLDDDLNYTFEGVQMIWRDVDTLKWVKKYNAGVVKQGSFTRVVEFDVKKTEFVYLCEGYATACTVWMATGVHTVCAFDSGNLDVVIEKLKALNPDIKIIICADDDFQTIINGKQVNVGILKAISACKKFQNVTYKKPKFQHRIDETDFNDLHILEGLEAVTDQLRINRAEFSDVILLGHHELSEFFYLCTQSKSIVALSPSKHKPEQLVAMADEKYWAEKYGYRKHPETGEMFADWKKITGTILARQREIGPFDPKLMRGLGVWSDDGRVFVNYGQGIYKVQDRMCVSNIDPHLKSKNFYTASSGEYVNFDDELTDEESLKIADAIKSLNFKQEHDYVFVIGFLAIANVFGALDWRPHLWITAPAGSGKSWIMKKLRALIYFHLAFKKTPSVAGVEQNIGNHAKVTVIDEAEAGERVDAVVSLARESSTLDAGLSGKGTADGKGLLTEVNTCFMMASIEPPHFTNQADDTRFFIVDMNGNENQTQDDFEVIEKKFKAIEGMSARLMVRMVNNIDMLKENIGIAKKALRAKKISAREADQLAPVIAGFLMFFTRSKIDEALVWSVAQQMGLSKSDYVERNETKQDDKVFSTLMMLKLNGQGLTVAEALKTSQEAGKTHFELQAHGMMWVDGKGLFIAATAPELDRKMKLFNLHNYRKVLERSPNFIKKNHVQRVGWSASGQAKGLLIKLGVVS